jgi:hypothetical protein
VCLPHPEKIELKKFSDPSENKKYATAQPVDRQKSVAKNIPKPLTVKRFNYSVDRRPACNIHPSRRKPPQKSPHSAI